MPHMPHVPHVPHMPRRKCKLNFSSKAISLRKPLAKKAIFA